MSNDDEYFKYNLLDLYFNYQQSILKFRFDEINENIFFWDN